MFRHCIALLSLISFLAFGVTPVVADVTYRVTDLCASPDCAGGCANSINSSGQVSGIAWFGNPSEPSAFLYSGGTMVNLGSVQSNPIHTTSCGYGINELGETVGYVSVPNSGRYPFLYSGGTMKNLGTVPGGYASLDGSAYAINNNSQVVGQSLMGYTSGSPGYPFYHAFLYTGGTMTDLGTTSGYSCSTAVAINDNGQIAGSVFTPRYDVESACVWNDGAITVLGSLPGYSFSWATSINRFGAVAGCAREGSNSRAVCWDVDGAITDLGTLPGFASSYSRSVNSNGDVVGDLMNIVDGTITRHAFIYHDGMMTDLNTLLSPETQMTITWAQCINDSGCIVGQGIDAAGYGHVVLLTPTPEPSTLALLGVGAAGLFGYWRRRRRARSLSCD